MKTLLLFCMSVCIISCHSNPETNKETTEKKYTNDTVIEKDSLLYLKNENLLFSGILIEKDSLNRVVKETNYVNGKKSGSEIHYEYFETDLPIIVLKGNWTDGKKSGIWKSRDGEGQITIIKNYDEIR